MSRTALGPPRRSRRAVPGGGFTLVELLVVVAILGVLAALFSPVLARSREAGRRTLCAARLRGVAFAVSLYAQDRDDRFPRSSHSGFAHQDPGWEKTLLRYLDGGAAPTAGDVRTARATVYRCPSDGRTAAPGYGLNVYFELDPDIDDYEGSPSTWRRTRDVERPAATVLFGEMAGSADHIMAHFWVGEAGTHEVAADRHREVANYAFVDGRVQGLSFEEVYAAASHRDAWNPGKAGR